MAEQKKEAFRKYLEGSGTIDVLTRVLVSLYEESERPQESTDYIKACLGAPTPDQFGRLEAENAKLQGDLEAAQEEISQLKARVAELEKGTEQPA